MVTPTFVFSVIVVTMAVLAFGTTQTYLRFSSGGPLQGCPVTGCVRPEASRSADVGPQGPAGAVPDGTARAQPSLSPRPRVPATAKGHPDTKIKITYHTLRIGYEGVVAVISITSHRAQPIRHWTLRLRTPGMRVGWLLGAQWRLGAKDAIIIQPEPSTGPLLKGQTVRIYFTATGTPAVPSGCVFNGSPCHVVSVQS
jgi:hypothetical protein